MGDQKEMAGTRTICKRIRVRCPHCNEGLDLSDMGKELFQRMLEELLENGRVEAEGFGTFRVAIMPPRKVANFGKGDVTIPSRKVIRFKASEYAKSKINGKENRDGEDTENR